MTMLLTEDDILHIIQEDPWMMSILQTVQKLYLPDWWIGAGFVRAKVWDYLHGYTQKTPLPDIDVIYFNASDLSEEAEEHIKKQLLHENPYVVWQVKNQARMHIFHNDSPYQSASEGLSHWVETATCIGVTLDENDNLKLTAPLGIEDLINLVIRPNKNTNEYLEIFRKRVRQKHWLQIWPKLKVIVK